VKPRIGLCCEAGAVSHRTVFLGDLEYDQRCQRPSTSLLPSHLVVDRPANSRSPHGARASCSPPSRRTRSLAGRLCEIRIRRDAVAGVTALPAFETPRRSNSLVLSRRLLARGQRQHRSRFAHYVSGRHPGAAHRRAHRLISQARSGRAAASLGHRRRPFPN
jgi:hypothetical protein